MSLMHIPTMYGIKILADHPKHDELPPTGQQNKVDRIAAAPAKHQLRIEAK